jgi:NitT/TauT family transport system ATP-binding protein
LKEPKVKLVNITRLFKTRWQTITALKDANIEIYEGDFVSLVGPSGCGKSTLIRIIDDIIKPTSGQVFIDGVETGERRIPKETIKKIGFIFQKPNLFPWLTIRQNIQLPLKIFGLEDKKLQMNLESLLEMTNLNESLDQYPLEISGGMMQKAGVIRAMVYDPEILLMDEPFGELDELTRENLDLDLLEIWAKTKKTIIFITHNIEEAILLASKIYVMGTNPGRIIAELNIDLPRPRTLDMIAHEKFISYEKEITDLIGLIDLDKIK